MLNHFILVLAKGMQILLHWLKQLLLQHRAKMFPQFHYKAKHLQFLSWKCCRRTM